MKNIKEYIINYFNESLFDTEDDLLDKRPTAEALKWFLDPKNVIGLWGTYNQKSSNYFKINDKGEIYLDKLFGNIIRLFKPIPSWINLDKKVWNSDTFFNIEYPIKSQKDIPSQGVIRQIENNKALEVNTSTISKPLGRPMPGEDLLKRYKNFGGKLITLGSDAHKKEVLGKDLVTAIEMLKKIGFSSYCYYEKHTPVEVKI